MVANLLTEAKKLALLTEAQLAEQLNLHPMTVKAWRLAGRGPRSLKFPGKKVGTSYTVRYRQEDVDAWLAALATKREVDAPSPRAKRSKRGGSR
jgi:hypothetical protein